MALTREQIFQAISLPIEKVDIEDLGEVNIRTLTVKDKEQYQRRYCNSDGKPNIHRSPSMMAGLIVMCLVDDAGKPMFTEDEINGFPARLGERLFVACAKVQGDEKEAQDLIAKNSETAPAA